MLTGPGLASSTGCGPIPRSRVVEECDPATGLVRQVIARGRAELPPFDVERGRRKLVRCPGADEERWDERFVHYLYDDPARRGTVWPRLEPVSSSGTT
ncbi:hypothetical protein ACF1G5_02270 [Streptomyces coeruleorubidus]|uniref:hypothetical protein n=1 Tax=Streptomyces coeruleorubidus TaxID=116188 RepID=UPI0036F8C55A